MEIPKTPRRPDVRMILNNASGTTLEFLNPGDHSGEKQESIPGVGEKSAVMIMLGGESLEQQYANAQHLAEKYNLSEKGLNPEFLRALSTEVEAGTIKEAYGPAPFNGQAAKLENLEWASSSISPTVSGNVAYGARPPEMETVMRSEIAIFIKGTSTTPEKMEMEGMCVAVASDWQTGAVSTRPIVPSVAKEFYGEHYSKMPVVELDTEGQVASIELKNGKPKIYMSAPSFEMPSFHRANPSGYDLKEPQ